MRNIFKQLWLKISTFLGKKPKKPKKSFQQKRVEGSLAEAEKALKVIHDFKIRESGEPFVVIAVQFVSQARFLATELSAVGYNCIYLNRTYDIPKDMSEEDRPADFYIGVKGVLATGWRSDVKNAAMFCFATLSENYRIHMGACLKNEATFYANGRYHSINGVPQTVKK